MSARRTGNKSASSDVNGSIDIRGLRRERPWLLPSNRKLRHLEGISIRNLALSRPSNLPQAKAADDESLPTSLRTPTKALALREKKLEHSRSSSDLRQSPNSRKIPDVDTQEKGLKPDQPPRNQLRRRSTLNWTNASPQTRQKKLEDVAGSKLADTWFSLHCEGVAEPVYVSEVVEKAMNPNFQSFDLSTYGPWITRKDDLTIKVWARTESTQQYVVVLELQLHLRSLQFLGKSLETFHHPLPANCVLLHLADGIYTSFTDLPLDEPVLAIPASTKNAQGIQSTSTFDELMRLSNLDDCIQDALATRQKLTSQISSLIERQKESRQVVQSAAQAQDSLSSTNRAVSTMQKQIKAAQARRSELQTSLRARRDAMRAGTSSQEKSRLYLTSAKNNFSSHVSLHQETQGDLTGQIRRICDDVLQIYPIEPVPRKALSFTIRGLPLPNATSPALDPAQTAAALGHVAHVTHLLSLYLSAALPYPITPYGSFSTIYDPISISLQSKAARTFPLYQKGAVAYRFEYGVFLLNSDIELLMSRRGIRIVDLRHTLPNLKYLLTVLTSGKGELPGRKEGRPGLQQGPHGEGSERKLSVDEWVGEDQHSTPPVRDGMFRQRQRRASNAVGDDLRGDTGAAALATLEQAPASDSPSDSDSPNPKPQAAQEPQVPQVPQELQEPQGQQEPQRPHGETQQPRRRRPRRRRERDHSWRGRLRRWGQFSLRHTWVNPLIIIALVLALYGIDPKPTNPLHSAIFLSYPLDPSDPLIPADIRSDPGAPIHYGKGGKDFAFFAFYVVVLSFTREFIMQLILRPLAHWFRLRTRSKQNRFMEQAYTALYFAIFGPYGLWVMYRSPVWYFNTVGMYESFPNRTHDALFKAYYLLQASYWGQQAIVLCLMLEKPRRDFKELIAHHVVTLALIWLSYRFHFTYMGLAVYITHDISDFFLAFLKTFANQPPTIKTSKITSYLELRIINPYFVIFMSAWVYLRHYLNIVILHSVTTSFASVGPFELDWPSEQYKCWIAQYITFALLACLQLINIFWLYFIVRIASRVFTGGVTKDDRSDDEAEDDEEDEDEDGEEEEYESGTDKEDTMDGELTNGALREVDRIPPTSAAGVRRRL
ncbi:MAG: hypothetical protein LQ344_003384 [Seirophora lacunosa]|nr:MAG: hypothetical protein LQ344_003384 [Seirophora lacunosa]